jgi:peptide/nickel transport system substrate-binding protein
MLLPGQSRAVALADAGRVVTAPEPDASFLFLNVHEPPFDDVGVRRALNFALDRRHVVELAGGGGVVALSCQVIPPGLPGYVPRCPFTSRGSLARARTLVAASGTHGARVRVTAGPKYAAVARYVRDVLRRLGYRAQARVFPDLDSYGNYVKDTRHRAQVGFWGWIADFATSSSFFDPFSCRWLVPRSVLNENVSQFCDPRIDAASAAALEGGGADANARWAALDRRVTDRAPLVPLFTRRALLLVSRRVGNAQMHQLLGPLLDQFWVR